MVLVDFPNTLVVYSKRPNLREESKASEANVRDSPDEMGRIQQQSVYMLETSKDDEVRMVDFDVL